MDGSTCPRLGRRGAQRPTQIQAWLDELMHGKGYLHPAAGLHARRRSPRRGQYHG